MLCPSPGMYAVTSIELVSRTRATLRKAEFGLLGVTVRTLVTTPRLNGEKCEVGLFFNTLNSRRIAGDFVFFVGRLRGPRISWFIVGILY